MTARLLSRTLVGRTWCFDFCRSGELPSPCHGISCRRPLSSARQDRGTVLATGQTGRCRPVYLAGQIQMYRELDKHR